MSTAYKVINAKIGRALLSSVARSLLFDPSFEPTADTKPAKISFMLEDEHDVGYALQVETDTQHMRAVATKLITEILDTSGVSYQFDKLDQKVQWEKLENWLVRLVYCPETNAVLGFGHVLADRWFLPTRFRLCMRVGELSDGLQNLKITEPPELEFKYNTCKVRLQLPAGYWEIPLASVRNDYSEVGPHLKELCSVLDVDVLGRLKGKIIRTRRTRELPGVDQIGNAIKDKWFTVPQLD